MLTQKITLKSSSSTIKKHVQLSHYQLTISSVLQKERVYKKLASI